MLWRIAEIYTDSGLLVEGQTCVDFCRDATWEDDQDLLAEFDKETIKSSAALSIKVASLDFPYSTAVAMSF